MTTIRQTTAQRGDSSRLDEAARAGWLYYIAGHTQDEIARQLNVSRATVQRLVSLCLSERLITFRLEHPITTCMDLATRLIDRFNLATCEIVPTDPAEPTSVSGIAERAGSLLETTLRSPKPAIVAIGTGRAMRAAVERVPPMDRPDHQLVSLVSNIATDGSATFFDTVGRLAERTKARLYPTPLPVLMSSEAARDHMLRMEPVAKVNGLAARADLRLIGVGQIDKQAQLHVDGFVRHHELAELIRLGAVGELTGWAFDKNGRFLKGGTNKRLTSVPLPAPAVRPTVAAALGLAKAPAILAALRGRLINGLITDEATARALLSD